MRKKQKKYKIAYRKIPLLYRLLTLTIALILVAGLFIFTNDVGKKLSVHNRNLLNAYARLWSLASTHGLGGIEQSIIYEEIIQKFDFPMVLTNVEGIPILWQNTEFSSSDTTRATREKLRALATKMSKKLPPVAIYIGESDRVLGYIYFGESPYVSVLKFMPFLVLALVASLLAIAYMSYTRLRHFEEQNIWLGMARETAHQLGTPISSLMGWLELLKEYAGKPECAEVFKSASQKPEQIISMMSEDIENLNKIVLRFGQVGSLPELELVDLPSLLSNVVNYHRLRMPKFAGHIEIIEQYEHVPRVMANKMLLSWAIENLIKNSFEAIPITGGQIKIATRLDVEGENVQIIVTDNGRGIPSRDIRKLFSPGFTTKKRGWGLGLSLAKRIVEQYHFGKIFLLETKPFEKTTFIINLSLPGKNQAG